MDIMNSRQGGILDVYVSTEETLSFRYPLIIRFIPVQQNHIFKTKSNFVTKSHFL